MQWLFPLPGYMLLTLGEIFLRYDYNLFLVRHLSTEQLRELFSSFRSQGWVDYDYYMLMIEGYSTELSDEEIMFTEPIRTITFVFKCRVRAGDEKTDNDWFLTDDNVIRGICTWMKDCWTR